MLQNEYLAELNHIGDLKSRVKSENFLIDLKKDYYLKKCFSENDASKSMTFGVNKYTPLIALNLPTPSYAPTDLIDRIMETVFTMQNFTLANETIYRSFLYYYTYLRPAYEQINSNILT